MKLEEILPGLYHVRFSSATVLSKTFMRFSEYYESPYFRGKIFTENEFKKWYIKNSPKGRKTGRFTYYQDWNDGFNFPSSTFKPFYDGKFDPLSKLEQELLDAFKDKKGKFYVIATVGEGEPAVLGHEKAHWLYNDSPGYKREVRAVIRSMSQKDKAKINSFFRSRGTYHPAVYEDETQAYLVDRRFFGPSVRGKGIADAGKEIKKIYKKYYKMQCKHVKAA